MPNQLKLLRRQAGDTIVEVMVVLAILGFAMGVSYATANASLKSTRQAQEASAATSLVESQVETVRARAPGSLGDAIFSDVPFCFGANNAIQTDLSSTDCTNLNPSGQHDAANGIYNLVITYCNGSVSSGVCTAQNGTSPLPEGTFVVRATWPDIAGEGNDTSTLAYRIHKNEYQ